VDLLKPVALQPLQIHSSVVRDGRRLRLVDAVMTQNDVMVARASALFLRRSEHTVDKVWTSPVTMPAVPAEPVVLADDLPIVLHSYGRDPVAGSPGVGRIAAGSSSERTESDPRPVRLWVCPCR
jgi:Thioesterase-like superfamily